MTPFFMKEYNFWGNILYEDVINDIDFQSIIDYAYDWKNKSSGMNLSNMGGWHSNYYDDNHPEVDKLISKIGEKVKTKLLHFWFNINPPQSYNGIHDHLGGPVSNSGAFYLKSRLEMGGIIFLKSRYKSPITGWRDSYKKLPAETGKIYTFPSHLLHAVGKNNTDEDRISVSFNF